MIDNKKAEIACVNDEEFIKQLLHFSYQAVKRLSVIAYNNTDGDTNRVDADSLKKIFPSKSKNWK